MSNYDIYNPVNLRSSQTIDLKTITPRHVLSGSNNMSCQIGNLINLVN